MKTMSGQDHIDICTAIVRIETTLEILQHDHEELSIKLENHMIEEALERKETSRTIHRINLLLVAILILSSTEMGTTLLSKILV